MSPLLHTVRPYTPTQTDNLSRPLLAEPTDSISLDRLESALTVGAPSPPEQPTQRFAEAHDSFAFVFDPDVRPPQEENLYKGFFAKGDLVIWVGREKHRKTNLVLQSAMCAALGRDFLWFRFAASKPQRVVFIDYESKSFSLWQRYQAICEEMALTNDEKHRLKENLFILKVRQAYVAGHPFPSFPVNKTGPENEEAREFWQRLIERHPADLYVIDPLRCFHARDENDSLIVQLLTQIRQHFKKAAVIVTHHMRKLSGESQSVDLRRDMRSWSDGIRGSSAFKAHADVVVCQERQMSAEEDEVVYLGAFLKDGPDIEPTALEESNGQSFFWKVCPRVPDKLKRSFDVLKQAGGIFPKLTAAQQELTKAGGKRATAYRHIGELRKRGFLLKRDGRFILQDPEVPDALTP